MYSKIYNLVYYLLTTRVPTTPARVTGTLGRPGVVEGVLRPVKAASAPTTAAVIPIIDKHCQIYARCRTKFEE